MTCRGQTESFAGGHADPNYDRFACVALIDHTSSLPALGASIVVLYGDLKEAIQQGTHLVVIGEVSGLHTADVDRPLIYLAGRYGSVLTRATRSAC